MTKGVVILDISNPASPTLLSTLDTTGVANDITLSEDGIAIYDDGMKKFLSTQTYKRRSDDGSIIFTLEYTQPLEILPFIQKWLPDLVILEPRELRDEYLKKLDRAVLLNRLGEKLL